jgi:EpsI family protein
VIFAVLVVPALWVATTRVGASAPSDPRRGLVLPHRSAAAVAIIATGLFAVPVAARVISVARHDDAAVSLDLPAAAAGWFGPVATRCPWLPSTGAPGAAAEACAMYESAGSGPVFVAIVAYAGQTEGQELVGRDGARPEGEWSVSASAPMKTSVGRPATVVAGTVADGRGPDWRMWHWYTIGSATTHRPWQVKLGAAIAFAAPRPAALTVIATPCAGDCERADEQLSGYLRAHGGLTKTLALAEGPAAPVSSGRAHSREP